MFRLRIKELATERGWTLKEVAERSELPYSTVATYANSPGMVMVNLLSVRKIARVFDVSIEELVEVLEE
ncbi:helix-turn-helix domain protein [Leptolyngbya boryana NIES-2135]|uniref:Helix-turn-helix domain protein n=1 Tax=Leptolyngbya boryana NIES-2135 TaxID=1973484 RepID=A0A1Z4J9L3_LEPBY|nr:MULTISPECIES: helix-turn-helix transcriptional regulator [Leptolyngbya]MBD2366716.1 helix-turn-helix transcriptional regulator [Leptolyngbya sp. FACHB-161]MBD2373270.1 helix-turn-helix transcriptional regulator [Leptolyngbya sp. FACHB-238]MBD2397670.1 helix-turn-helix transcriptional regulator [Leptolyngbya sp. FACHB-239]MBD2404814.1 helix-turn-helix transcriptional regulator [Leptolyngbya sp. FACHB-402]BAY53420.1 helix-turn-helix domain protein [Leptolyngbya boryana NIES-2135]